MTRATASALTPLTRTAAGMGLFIRAAVAVLALFHGWLFISQVARGQLTDPGLALRWIVAGGLVTALAVLWRRGESLAGRRAVAIWVLAALLHGPALAERQVPDNLASVPGAVVSVLLIAGPAGLTLLLLRALTRRSRHGAGAPIPVLALQVFHRPSGVAASWSCAPRPPPRI